MLFIHFFVCIWIWIGSQSYENFLFEKGLISDLDDLTSVYTEVYIDTLYYLTTTMTTIGYGDNYAVSMAEKLVAILFEFFGICMFSYIQQKVLSLRSQVTLDQFVNNKLDEITYYMFSLDRVLKEKKMSTQIYDETIKFMDYSMRYSLKDTINYMNFFDELPPRLQTKLCRVCLDKPF